MAVESSEIVHQQEGNPAVQLSVSALYSLHHRALLSWLRQRLPVPADADDVAQEAWIRLMRYEGASNIACPKALLYTVAANLANDHERMSRSRCRRQHYSIDEDDFDIPSLEPSIERIVEGMDAYRRLCERIDLLPPKCRRAFVLSKMHGMTYPQIALHCNISIKMVEKHISHALCVLQKKHKDAA